MNGKKAKQLRRQIYGTRVAKYFINKETGTIYRDEKRRIYQKLKEVQR